MPPVHAVWSVLSTVTLAVLDRRLAAEAARYPEITAALFDRLGERSLRLATTHGIRQAVSVVDAVYNASGVTAIYDGHPLQRQFQDIHVISQHLQARFAHYELVGQHWLGLPVDETRL